MTVRIGADYLVGTPTWAKGLGATFACRYLSNLTNAEAKELTALGIDVVTLWETAANRALDGYGAGVADATAGFSKAHSVGMPVGRPVYFTVDMDDTGDPAVIKPYFQGVDKVAAKGTRAAYGGLATIKFLFDEGLIDFGFQTSAWSSEGHPLEWDARAHLRQVSYHAGYDTDEAVVADFGQWNLRPPTPPPTLPVLTTLQREELASMRDHLPAIVAQQGRLTKEQVGELRTMYSHLGAIPGVK